jgi:hypothetical protein
MQYQAQQQEAVKAKSRADAQAAMMERNAKIAEQNAKDAESRGKKEEVMHNKRVRLFRGSQRAAMGGSGATVDVESFGELLEDTDRAGFEDALTIRKNTATEAWRHRAIGVNYASQGNLYSQFGRSQFRAGQTRQAGILLGGLGSLASAYQREYS